MAGDLLLPLHGPLQLLEFCADGVSVVTAGAGTGRGTVFDSRACRVGSRAPESCPASRAEVCLSREFFSAVMAELRVVCRLFRYHGSANRRYLISDDPLLRFRKRPADGSGDYASYRLDRVCRTGCTGLSIAVRIAAWTSGFLTICPSLFTGVGIPRVTGTLRGCGSSTVLTCTRLWGRTSGSGSGSGSRARGMSRFTGGWRSCSLRGFRAGCSSSWRTGSFTGRAAGLLTTLLRFPLPLSAPVFAVVQAGAVSLFLFPGRAVRSSHRSPRCGRFRSG